MPARATLRIATFNVNGIGTRLGHLLAWLEREQPDIVALQELKADDAAFPAADIEAAGYGASWIGQRSWNGVAILGRGVEPVESRRGLPGDPGDTQSRYLEAAVHGVLAAHGQFQLLCALRRGPWGVEGLNPRIAGWLRESGLIPAVEGWYAGRPVLVTRNDYGLGLMNGDIGITFELPVATGSGPLRVAFPAGDGQGGIK